MKYDDYFRISDNQIIISDYRGELTALPEEVFEDIESLDHLDIFAKNIAVFPDSLNKIRVKKSLRIHNNKSTLRAL